MKIYNGEKAIISLTSWKARIGTVAKTLYSLIKQCPGFHIVLVLSEEEFPRKEDELPENLRLFIDNDLIEVLWVYKNYKSFKKVLFTMDKYRDVPVISADDDCVYTCNYALSLYKKWYENKNCVITYRKDIATGFQNGQATLYPPKAITLNVLNENFNEILKTNHDDVFIGLILKKLRIEILEISNKLPYKENKDNKFSLRFERRMLNLGTPDYVKIIEKLL